MWFPSVCHLRITKEPFIFHQDIVKQPEIIDQLIINDWCAFQIPHSQPASNRGWGGLSDQGFSLSILWRRSQIQMVSIIAQIIIFNNSKYAYILDLFSWREGNAVGCLHVRDVSRWLFLIRIVTSKPLMIIFEIWGTLGGQNMPRTPGIVKCNNPLKLITFGLV